MENLLDRKVIMITGAGSGIGLAAAKLFSQYGARVAVTDLMLEAAKATSDLLTGEALPFSCDIRSEDSIKQTIHQVLAEFGELNGAFNNAGIGSPPCEIAESAPSEWARVLNVDLIGTFMCVKHQLAAMVPNGGGAIVLNASNAGKAGAPLMGPYGAAKAGVINLVQTTAVEYAARGIRINAVCPGLILTEAVSRIIDKGFDLRANYQIPMEREGQPKEVAELAAWLLSDSASYVTGQAISIDGGASAMQ